MTTGLLVSLGLASTTGLEVRPANGAEQPLTKQPPTLPELYSRTIATDPSSDYDHSQFIPQVLSKYLLLSLHCILHQYMPDPVCTVLWLLVKELSSSSAHLIQAQISYFRKISSTPYHFSPCGVSLKPCPCPDLIHCSLLMKFLSITGHCDRGRRQCLCHWHQTSSDLGSRE